MTEPPRFVSIAFEDILSPDFADVAVAAYVPGSPEDPAVWAGEVFSVRSAPLWVRAALGLRQLVAPLIGVRLVVFETTLLGAVGGVVGCFVGLVLVLAFSVAQGWIPVFDPGLIPLAIGIGVILGALSGLVPAIRAATVEPISALRRV